MSHNDIKPTVSMSEAASSHTDLEKEGFAETTFNGTRIQRVAELDKAAGNGVQTVRSGACSPIPAVGQSLMPTRNLSQLSLWRR